MTALLNIEKKRGLFVAFVRLKALLNLYETLKTFLMNGWKKLETPLLGE